MHSLLEMFQPYRGSGPVILGIFTQTVINAGNCLLEKEVAAEIEVSFNRELDTSKQWRWREHGHWQDEHIDWVWMETACTCSDCYNCVRVLAKGE